MIIGGPGCEDTVECVTASGLRVAGRSDKGIDYSPNNEDRGVIVPEANFVGVVDGVGGFAEGEESAQIVADAMAACPEDIEIGIGAIRHLLRGAALIMAIRFEKNNRRARLFQAGDAKAVIRRRSNGRILESWDERPVSEDYRRGCITYEQFKTHPRSNIVSNGIGQNFPFNIAAYTWGLRPGDKVLIGSDGIFDNLTAEEIFSLGKSGRELLDLVWKITETRMLMKKTLQKLSVIDASGKTKAADGFELPAKRDNRTLFAVDVP